MKIDAIITETTTITHYNYVPPPTPVLPTPPSGGGGGGSTPVTPVAAAQSATAKANTYFSGGSLPAPYNSWSTSVAFPNLSFTVGAGRTSISFTCSDYYFGFGYSSSRVHKVWANGVQINSNNQGCGRSYSVSAGQVITSMIIMAADAASQVTMREH